MEWLACGGGSPRNILFIWFEICVVSVITNYLILGDPKFSICDYSKARRETYFSEKL